MNYDEYAQLRDEKGLTDYKIAQDTGISRATLSEWKKGKYQPKIDKINVLKEYFGCDDIESQDEIKYESDSHTWDIDNDYYINKDSSAYAQFLKENPGHRVLFDAVKNVKAEDLQKALKAIGIFTEE